MIRKKASLNSESFLQKKRSRRTKILLLTFLFVFLLASLFVILCRLPVFAIETVEVKGLKTISETELTQFVKGQIEGKYLILIPKNSFFIVSRENIKESIQNNFKGVKNIKVSVTPKKIEVSLDERSAAFLACTEEGECYYSDSEGFVFEKAPVIEGFLYKRLFGGEIEIGKQYPYVSSFIFAEEADTLLAPTGEKIEKVVTSSKRESEFFTTSGVKILWSPEKDTELGIKNLRALLYYSSTGKPKSEEELRTFFHTLDYIDVRFSGKVYFKNK